MKNQVHELMEMMEEMARVKSEVFAIKLTDALVLAGVEKDTVQLMERIARNDNDAIVTLAEAFKGGNV
ncbi:MULTISPECIES: hypothetical protein [Cytobacillus]|uniref:hypothetical protein n=1 Tax=Cytobacillus TaxID=2675230 RepID=UPI00203F5F6F|nr:hypothetical protein [Cytobacillus firmus]MCM3705842.1 hypothetical protein [Cytobacillus firmus]